MSFLSQRHVLYRHAERLLFRIRVGYSQRRQIRIEYGDHLQLVGVPRLQLMRHSALDIGSHVTLRSSRTSNPIGVDHPVTFCTLSEKAQISIGNHVGISGGAICARQLIQIGDYTLIGANTYIFDNDFHPIDGVARTADDQSAIRCAPVCIGSNVFVGTRSIILKGVTIGDNSIIGAGSVVSQSVPSNVIAAGNPCRIIRKI